eukprot:TRINITY_DN8970_c0_g1_i1.p1 TRINITY_DN8970_c0_g1~~TRINITY_DN8970_c0_g1_i1.p1  ORF type:complete len:1064 (+),score=229.75 TRINITY_DN8970_c0_g1_i1:447-3194(+)
MVDQKMIPDRGLYVSMIRTLNKEGKSKEIGELVFGMGQYGIDPHETCSVLVKAECHEKAAEVLESAVSDGYLPSHESVLSIFSAYSSSKRFSEACSFVNLFTDPKISIAIRQELVVMLSKAKQIETAVKEFKKLRDCSPKIDNFVYESLLEACEQTGMSSEASQLYLDMKSSALQLTPRCYRSLALVYCKMGLPATAHSLLDFAAKSGSGTGNGTSIHVALIQAYGKQGMWQKAEKYFAELHVTDKVADDKVWGALISAYAISGCYEQAKAAFDQMLKDGLSPTVKTINDLVKACINGDAMGQIYALLEDIQKVGFKISRSTILLILNGFAKAGDVFEVKRIYNNMKVAGYAPNMQAYRIVICALCNCKRVKSVNALLHEMKIGGLKPDFSIYKAMIKMYMKINNPQKALEICKGMKADGFSPDNGTYDILISMYSRLLMPEEGSRILTQMRIHGHFPTLDSCRELLSACCRKQLWDESEKLFKQMQSSCKLDRPAYHTMLNAYTHRGKHKKAQCVVAEMKNSGIIPNLATMCILKKSSKIAGEPQRSEALFKKLTASGLSLGVAQYTMVVDAYLNIGDYTTAIGKLLKMKNDGIEPDCRTWTCVIGAASICKHTNEAVGLLNALHDTGFSLPIRLLTETYKNMLSEIESLFERLKGAEEEIVFGFINALEDLLWAFEQRATAACIFHMAIQRDIYSPDIFWVKNKNWGADFRGLSSGAALVGLTLWLDLMQDASLQGTPECAKSVMLVAGTTIYKNGISLKKTLKTYLWEMNSPFYPCQTQSGVFVAKGYSLCRWLKDSPFCMNLELKDSPDLPSSNAMEICRGSFMRASLVPAFKQIQEALGNVPPKKFSKFALMSNKKREESILAYLEGRKRKLQKQAVLEKEKKEVKILSTQRMMQKHRNRSGFLKQKKGL